ncbi:hypothetical protein JTB14_037667 [Gonioctena quinquepunctata]|nr:hypothetical protein JTB14_037667 [Gonioctena quinquepunctata]
MVLIERNTDMDEAMPQTVPSAGFTPPCDYSAFADYFDLSLLPGGDQPVSPSTQFYVQSPSSFESEKPTTTDQPKIFTTFYPNSPPDIYPTSPTSTQGESDIELGPDFQTLLVPEGKTYPNIYLEVPSPSNVPSGGLSPYSPQSQGLLSPNDNFTSYRQSGEGNFYPSSPEQSLYTASPSSIYSTSPCGEDILQAQYIKKEAYSNAGSPLPNFSPFRIKEEGFTTSPDHLYLEIDNADVLTLLEASIVQKQIKKEVVEELQHIYKDSDTLRQLLEKDLKKPEGEEKPKDHLLLREVLRDTSFQKKFNIKPIDFGFLGSDIKMEEPEQDLLRSCNEEMVKGGIEPVLNLAIEQMRKDVDNTCATLGISADPSQWDSASVLSWIRWTSRQFSLPEPVAEQWDMPGSALVALPEDDFTRRASQGGMILHAQLEIWKAAYSDEDLQMQWRLEPASSNASSGDVSDEEEEEAPLPISDAPAAKPTTSRSGSHIHLWQFLKELLASPQTHGSCIRWLDRTKGIFKIEDSVKVARLWGKRKNRPAMNYDKLSRSIRQYYKKGIMKKTESFSSEYLNLFAIEVKYNSSVLFVGEDAEDEVTVETVDEVTPSVLYESPSLGDPKKVHFAEHFDDDAQFQRRWVKSQAKKEGIDEDIAKYDGVWAVEGAQRDALSGDSGLVLKSKAKHAAIAAALNRPFVFRDKPLIVQYEVLFQDGQECGGAYLKLLSDAPETKKLDTFHDKTPYTIMFGPDKCGNDHKLHFIFKHKNPRNGTVEEKHCQKPKERLEDFFTDKLPHLYTLVLKPDNTFEIMVDRKVVNSGSLLEDFVPPVNPQPEIDDANDKKPADWDEREKIPDPDAKKPDDWDEDAPAQIVDESAVMPDGWLDNEPTHVPDPDAVKPADWDADMDGEWEAPLIENAACAQAVGCGSWEPPLVNNPAFKGKWRAPMIDNPNYKGKWRPRRIANPEFFEDKQPFRMTTVSAVGFELWSMSQDILFDNIIITEELAVADKWAADTFDKKRQKIAKDSESVIQRLANWTNDYPMLWAVYILVLAVPVVFVLYLCCKPSSSASQTKVELLLS